MLDAHHADNVAVAVLDNRSGEWLAWEGSGNYADNAHGGAIDGVTSPRQPGSALKPFTYAAAFESGYQPASVLADVPSQFPTDEPGVLYSPRNYDGQYRGPLLAREALAGSENVPAVALASDLGVPAVARLLRRAGFTSLGDNASHYGLGLTLGNAEVRLDEIVAAYAMFARGGEYLAPSGIRSSIDGHAQPAADAFRLLSARTAFWITDILSDNDARAYMFGRGGSLEFPFPVAAKTGTSTAYHDNWAVGYTREVTVGVWVGNFDRTPLRDSSGVTGAGPDLPRRDARRCRARARHAADRRPGADSRAACRGAARARLRAVRHGRGRVVSRADDRVGGRPTRRSTSARGTHASDARRRDGVARGSTARGRAPRACWTPRPAPAPRAILAGPAAAPARPGPPPRPRSPSSSRSPARCISSTRRCAPSIRRSRFGPPAARPAS